MISNCISSTTTTRRLFLQPSSRGFCVKTFLNADDHKHVFWPPPPPREYNPDGTLKKYPVTKFLFRHPWQWEQYTLTQCGQFHTMYWGDFGCMFPPRKAFAKSFTFSVWFPCALAYCFILAHFIWNWKYFGYRPKKYTVEWLVATRQRERAENCNPISRYYVRRVAERGHDITIGDHYILDLGYYMPKVHDWKAAEMLYKRSLKDKELEAAEMEKYAEVESL